MVPPRRKQGGFFWWLLWIAVAVGSFILSAIFWTWFLGTLFGPLQGAFLTILWAGTVFGSWLLTMIPVIRAKERYWNRLSREDETNVTWWIGWIALTIAAFFASAGFWTWFFAKDGGSIREAGVAHRWVFAVFGTWMIALLPLIVVMYRKVDQAYERARQKREANEGLRPRARTVYVDPAKRVLGTDLAARLGQLPITLKKGGLAGQVVTAVLKDGRKFENVFVMNAREILGIYGRDHFPFEAGEIVDFEAAEVEKIPSFCEENWLRLDGR
jgi:uncharacterized membrane protein